MHRRSFPIGQASTAMLKALWRALSYDKGAAVADAWLRSIRMERDDLDDETRMIPIATLRSALARFVESAGSRGAIPAVWPHLVAPDVMGIWVRVLRGTSAPGEAFARLDSADSEYGRTTRWETIDTSRAGWRGRVIILHDPSLEDDGLLRLARLAELAAVPALFGYRGAVAREHMDDGTSAARPRRGRDQDGTSAAGPRRGRDQDEPRSGALVQEFEVTWHIPNPAVGSVLGAAVGCVLGAAPLALHLGSTGLGVAWTVAGAIGGALAGLAIGRDRARRAETHAQTARVHALERSLMLKESRDRIGAGTLEGSVVAGQYRIVRRMGAGATGVIYEAARISDGIRVALKLLRVAAAHEAVASDRLRREAEALGLAWHPNVVEVIDHGHLPDGTSYLVMELLHGESLAARLKTKGRLTPPELSPIAMQVCDALAAVHAAGVVHRDLKPSNIYLTRDDDGASVASPRRGQVAEAPAAPERVKLIDFGIARVEWEETRITHTGGPLGTPGYMPPEQETGTGEVDGRSDLFALGAMLYECLVGEPPPPPTPSGYVRAAGPVGRSDSGTQRAAALLPASWRTIIDKAMAPNPADRYQDARAFAQALRDVRDEKPPAEASS
jgi:tRNA A-37 threonylcarbamoyl transferase component Bud32